MPCRGPDESEVRAADENGKLYTLILDLSIAMGVADEDPFDDDFLSEVAKNLQATKNAYRTDVFFHRATAVLCDVVGNFTPDQQERYLYDGRDPLNVRLNFWWMGHQKIDAERRRKEALHHARQKADAEGKVAYNKAYNATYARLTDGIL